MKKFNIQALSTANWDEVLEALGCEKDGTNYHCPLHKDNKGSLGVTPANRTKSGYSLCHCFSCDFSGNPINLVQEVLKVDFKAACEWLHSVLAIPFLEGEQPVAFKPIESNKDTCIKTLKPFEPNKIFANIIINDYMKHYGSMSEAQKLKMIYTTFYRLSLNTNQEAKNRYYLSRQIAAYKVNNIGCVNNTTERNVIESILLDTFPIDDLERFKLFKDNVPPSRGCYTIDNLMLHLESGWLKILPKIV